MSIWLARLSASASAGALGVVCAAAFGLAAAGLTAQPAGAVVGSTTTYSHLPGRYIGSVNATAERYFAVTMRAGSTAQDARIVAQYFQHFGLRTEIAPDNTYVFVDGTYAQAGAAAHVGFARVELRGDRFTTTTGAEIFPPEVASRIAVTTINEGPHVHPQYVLPPAYLQVAPSAGYAPANIATYYNITPIYTAGIKGASRAVAIAACLNIKATDISKFESVFGIPANAAIVRAVGTSTTANDIEPTLDVERVIGTAPSVKAYLYYIVSCSVGDFATMLAKIYSDYIHNPSLIPNLDSLTISYGLSEHDYDACGSGCLSAMSSQHTTFSNLQSKGITTFAASGDNGSYGDLTDGDITVLYPASDSNVLAIGGTSANSISPTTTTRRSENGWGGSGGGVSVAGKCTSTVKIGCMPAWQMGVTGMLGTTSKNLPDFSLAADPNTGYQMYVTFPSICGTSTPCLLTVGGTSTSSPTWAAFLALVNNYRVTHAKARLPAVQTNLYAQRTTAGIYFDEGSGSGGYYNAHAGYDNLTGLGSPNFYNLYLKLIAI